MISYDEAHNIVLDSALDFGTETISIENSINRVLAENIIADRDFPPFDRVTKDGIAIKFDHYISGKNFMIQEIAAAGSPQTSLRNLEHCIEVMTGSMLPVNTDTVIMYEELIIADGFATINSIPQKGQNIHLKGSDQKAKSILLSENFKTNTQSIGLLATVGKSQVKVKKLPNIAILSTGNELIPIENTPKPHQIRSSNSISLKLLLKIENINADTFHIPDDKKIIKSKLYELLQKYDVIMMSGGVSMGKFDFLPEILEELKVTKFFHRVAQRPGKPFWFGQHKPTNTTVFSFPGNPVSTYVNFHIYFRDWLSKCLDQEIEKQSTFLKNEIPALDNMTLFRLVELKRNDEILNASPIKNNGSGDLLSLSHASGIIEIKPNSDYYSDKPYRFIPFLSS